jgi:hypothetical protein
MEMTNVDHDHVLGMLVGQTGNIPNPHAHDQRFLFLPLNAPVLPPALTLTLMLALTLTPTLTLTLALRVLTLS